MSKLSSKGTVRTPTPMYCPVCGNKLQVRSEGLVCKNWKCPMYWKYGCGPVYRGRFGWQIREWKPFKVPPYEVDRDE